MWDVITAHCPKGKDTEVFFPNPREIEELVCKIATEEQVKDKAVGEVCQVITEKFPKTKFQPDCPTVLTALWDSITAHCPKGKDTEVFFPDPREIEELVCKIA